MSKVDQKADPKKASKPDTASGKRPPGKGNAKEAEEAAKHQNNENNATEQNVVHIETEGFGKFEFIDGTIYEGQWKLIDGVKMRHGEGVLRHPGITSESGEEYKGTWLEDKKQGYGVYRYTSGAIFSGEWLQDKQEGKGLYEFPDGSKYEGEWKNHKMHGDGAFTDISGTKWEGIFVDGIYQSKIQKQLQYEKQLKILEEKILESANSYFKRFEKTFAESDKKTFKENLLPFFATSDEVKSYFKDPFPKYEDRVPDKWNSAMTYVSQSTYTNALRAAENAKIVSPENILATQFSDVGQVVEFERVAEERTVKVALCNTAPETWVLVYFFDTAPAKDK